MRCPGRGDPEGERVDGSSVGGSGRECERIVGWTGPKGPTRTVKKSLIVSVEV